MLIIKSNQFQVTEAMKDVAIEKFRFLGLHELENLRLNVETLKAHRLRIKAIYQQPKQKPLVMEVLVEDFYKGMDQLAKKMKNTLKRQEDKLRHRHDKIALGLAMKEIEDIEQEELMNQVKRLDVPLYQFTGKEAIKQFDLFDYQVLMYYDLELGSTCTLVRQPDGLIKQYISVD